MLKSNREYKSSVFAELFSEKSNLLELYNAIENTSYGIDTDIRMTTLSNALFKDLINDISFIIEGKIVVLIEHQSSINENMPLRMLQYISEVYKAITEYRDLYREKRMSIPKPEFIVLYNGKKDYPEHKKLKLSEMFTELGAEAQASLELEVDVYNINKGSNKTFAEKSKTLSDYEIFVYLTREYCKSMSRDEAIERAVKECINRNVLRVFLDERAREVTSMIFGEWDWDLAKEVWQEEAREEG
ncbi:MAG: Rpn family recombination-promoting nuclease/putative transposase, partial [Fibromonadaceae bacterium]|nr:Rpn family recombination-promoting nuclease/putative transposase [Fibromonadaceae bacterium]